MNYEGMYLVSLLSSKKLDGMQEIREEHFSDVYKPVYAWITQFIQEHRHTPHLETARALYPFLPDSAPEDPTYYANAVRNNAARVFVESAFHEEVIPHLRDARGDLALDGIKRVVAEADRRFQRSGQGDVLADFGDNAMRRFQAYELRETVKGLVGIPTLWPTLTRAMGGLAPGQVLGILARPKVGKTLAAIAWAVYLWELGYRVLFVSMETPPEADLPLKSVHHTIQGTCMHCHRSGVSDTEECPAASIPLQLLSVRFDAIAMRVSLWRFFRGCLTPQEKDRSRKYFEAMSAKRLKRGSLRIVGYPVVRTVEDLEAETAKYAPDIVFWDSAYLGAKSARSARRESNPYSELLIHFKLALRRLQVAGVFTWHFNRDVDEEATDASLNSAAHTDDMGRVVEQAIGLFRPLVLQDAREAIIRSVAVRDGVPVSGLKIKFDVIDGVDFSEMPGDVAV